MHKEIEMVLSMTGYGKVTGNFREKVISVEIKSLNSKGMDAYVKTPPVYRERELSLRQLLSDRLIRGKVDVLIAVENTGAVKNNEINKALAQAYVKELKELDEIVGQNASDYHNLILRMPDIFVQSNEALDEEEQVFLDKLFSQACEELCNFRKQEGEALKADFENNIGQIKSLLGQVEPFEGQRMETLKERMRKNLDDQIQAQIDENRFQQELIFYMEKLDVSEEKMRLSNHLEYFLETMKTETPGKKLGFIAQEIGREVNTLGSKANHVEIQKLVVEMKDCLEKIKEQVLNTL